MTSIAATEDLSTIDGFTSIDADNIVFTTISDLDLEHTGTSEAGTGLIRLDVDGEGFDEVLSSNSPRGHRERLLRARDVIGRARAVHDQLTSGARIPARTHDRPGSPGAVVCA
jgi:hypothetical protein